MTEPPPKTFSEGPEPRRGAEAERAFQWYTPTRRRATVYEDVTIDTQPSVHRHMKRGWAVCFEGGQGTWDESSTELRSSDWYDFRDPGEQWERPFFQQGSAYEAQIEGAVRAAASDRLFEAFSEPWIEFLRSFLQVPAYVEHGLWLPIATSARDCLSDSIATCVAIEAAMKQRLAQAIVLYAMDLEPHFGELPIEQAKERFLNEEAWQPVRRYLERLQGLIDWGELIVAVNLCFEPLVGLTLRRELGIRAASANGDTITPVIARGAQLEWAWTRDWTVAFAHFVAEDEAHGEHNRQLLGRWLGEWLPRAREALDGLTPVAAAVPGEFSYEDARVRIDRDLQELLSAAGIAELEGVAA